MQKPEIEFIEFEITDVITTSGMDIVGQKQGDYGKIVAGIGNLGGIGGMPLQ